MRRGDGSCDLADQPSNAFDRHRAALHLGAQRDAVDVLDHQVRQPFDALAGIENSHYRVMIDASQRFHLLAEAVPQPGVLRRPGRQELDDDALAGELFVARQVHRRHAALRDEAFNTIARIQHASSPDIFRLRHGLEQRPVQQAAPPLMLLQQPADRVAN